MIWFSIFCLIVGAGWGYVFWVAVMHQEPWAVFMWAFSLGLWQADKLYKSEVVRGFINGLFGVQL